MQGIRANWLLFVYLAGIAIFGLRALPAMRDLASQFAQMDNDDILRLVMVRDLLAGQGWFDTTQYRFLPPSGVVMHWSRYVDLGIAAVIGALAGFMPLPKAELWASALWPAGVFALHLWVLVYGTARLFGRLAAAFAALIAVVWPVTGYIHSDIGNLDHHNVQMLLLSAFALALIWPQVGAAGGAVAGAAAALSLAVGLETLPLVLVMGITAFWQALRHGHGSFLLSFALVLAVAATALFWGQTAPALRDDLWCDRLGLPVLALVWLAAGVCLAALLARPRGPWPALALAGVTLGAGGALMWPLFGPCLAGPYGDLPADLQMMIATQITEARGAVQFARESPVSFVMIALPVIACVLGTRISAPANQRILWLLTCCALGLMLYQMRLVILAGAVVPILGGALLAAGWRDHLALRRSMAALRLLGLLVGLAGSVSLGAIAALIAPPASSAPAACRDPDALAVLNGLPPATFLTPLDLGPALLWASHHAVVSAGYHVNATLLGNAMRPFALDPHAAFLRAAQDTGAQYLLVCAATAYDGAAVRDLTGGAAIAGLTPVPLAAGDLRVFAIAPR